MIRHVHRPVVGRRIPQTATVGKSTSIDDRWRDRNEKSHVHIAAAIAWSHEMDRFLRYS